MWKALNGDNGGRRRGGGQEERPHVEGNGGGSEEERRETDGDKGRGQERTRERTGMRGELRERKVTRAASRKGEGEGERGEEGEKDDCRDIAYGRDSSAMMSRLQNFTENENTGCQNESNIPHQSVVRPNEWE